MYASPVTRMMSQLSQPSSSISARVVGKNGAMPNRFAQYGRYENRLRGADIVATVSTPAACARRFRRLRQDLMHRASLGLRGARAAVSLRVGFLGLGRLARRRA